MNAVENPRIQRNTGRTRSDDGNRADPFYVRGSPFTIFRTRAIGRRDFDGNKHGTARATSRSRNAGNFGSEETFGPSRRPRLIVRSEKQPAYDPYRRTSSSGTYITARGSAICSEREADTPLLREIPNSRRDGGDGRAIAEPREGRRVRRVLIDRDRDARKVTPSAGVELLGPIWPRGRERRIDFGRLVNWNAAREKLLPPARVAVDGGEGKPTRDVEPDAPSPRFEIRLRRSIATRREGRLDE